MQLSLFPLIQQLVEEAELQVLSSGKSRPGETIVETILEVLSLVRMGKALATTLRRRIISPVRFVIAGGRDALYSIKWLAGLICAFFVLLLIGFILCKRGYIPIDISTYTHIFHWSILSVPFLFLLVLFAVPSTFAFDTIQPAHVESLADSMEKLGFNTGETIKALEESLQIVADRCASRATTSLWVISSLWVGFLLLFNLSQSYALKLDQNQLLPALLKLRSELAEFVGILLLLIVPILCHRRAMNAVFNRLRFATKELRYRLAIKPTQADIVLPNSSDRRIPKENTI